MGNFYNLKVKVLLIYKEERESEIIIDIRPAVIDGSSSRAEQKTSVSRFIASLDGYRHANWTTKRHHDYKRSSNAILDYSSLLTAINIDRVAYLPRD